MFDLLFACWILSIIVFIFSVLTIILSFIEGYKIDKARKVKWYNDQYNKEYLRW